ncbi:hypothetical protein LOK49_LG05G01081 [Camellia lanceoleosa]|uniref:Uncharacterized protein n=1 Tax=Camellia lanceoleosa TaxID=1840588 RepID=A0ACC0HUB3_9ERIC|nr:hypothetical protein LOK49_LG05G01081 [Camellia lanceoleosa]
MSLESEIQSSPDMATESFCESKKHSKISYTRDFLLSLSELDVCKRLPSGFDQSILRRSDKDYDSQSDRDSESGRRYDNQSRQSYQNSEHDGLLGGGSFPRPSGYAAGFLPAVISRYLTQGEAPMTHSMISQDKAEEEIRRRVSFELMRKEQQKALQEKQNLSLDKHKSDLLSDFTELLEDTKDGARDFNRSNKLDESITQSVLNDDYSKSSLQTPAFRPLVPPGFRSIVLEKNSSSRSLTHSHLVEAFGS